MNSNVFLKSYLLFSFVYLLLPFLEMEDISWYFKPFLVPFLIIAVIFSTTFSTKKLLLTALVFSWLGDIVLMFADKSESYFILGLASFLVSHLLYIWLFIQQNKNQKKILNGVVPISVLIILGYFVAMISLLFPKLGALQIPVTVYAIVITVMLYVAFKGSLQWSKPAAFLVLIGAVFFVLSDSILAFNKFYQTLPHSGFWIMSTYILAQYFIVSGVLQLNKKK